MLPFIFKVSIKCNTIHFFPTNQNYPFFLTRQADEKHSKIESGLQLTFDEVLRFQSSIKRRYITEARVSKLLKEINGYMNGSDAIWIKTSEIDIDDFDFHVFTLVSKTQMMSVQKITKKKISGAKRPHDEDISSPTEFINENKTPFFRPWQ